ncbi:Polyprenol-phosphate-mannose-dependent alpha-(1-2)-phosphatidylinositol mannoside mannosyltransferase [Arthrobacter agilis]|uniref:glycosyltransferase 87 family protein n=1 Tax=Arthrobacter agilis TaxID=37921 RepID=UPI000F71EC7D|nr:glycosyltransferase 87 family protein [Arthrobacter agilis]VDR33088.1 Polyprenol-phosphate-mannose-dependent alpha-(1-2)-phosphatidylinositol mannoside mannosyltransferase [Arthrobacter agilis]
MSERSTPAAARAAGIVAAVIVAAALVVWAFAWADFIGLDYRVYRMGGQSVVDGDGSLYTRLFGEGEGSLLFTYPPFAALTFTALTLVSAETGAMLFVGLSVVIAAVTSLVITRYLGGFRSLRGVLTHPSALPLAIVGTGLVCLLGPWRETMAFSQVNILLFAMIAADLLSGPHRRVPTGLLTGIAAGVKLTPLVFGLYFLVRGEWKQLFTMAAGFLGTIALGFIFLPSESATYWLQMLRDTGRIGGEGYVDNLSVRGAILHVMGPDFPSTIPWLIVSLLLVAAATYIIRTAQQRGDRFLPMAMTALLMLLISPISWSHHWVWIVVVLAVLAGQAAVLPPALTTYRRAAMVLFVVTLVVFVYSPKTIGLLLGAEDLNSQLTTGWLVASSAGVLCALAVTAFWVLLSRALAHAGGTEAPGAGTEAPATAMGGPSAARSTDVRGGSADDVATDAPDEVSRPGVHAPAGSPASGRAPMNDDADPGPRQT